MSPAIRDAGWTVWDLTVHLTHLRLRQFRNYARLDVAFGPGFQLLLGDNAQGKTNILEAIYLLGTLRSFRGANGAQMVRHGQTGYFVGASVIGERTRAIRLYWSATERRLTLDGQPVRRLADYFGTVRAVVFCSDDVQLVKGPSSRRRRFLDLLLAQTQPNYLALLQRYMKAVRSRNVLLKARTPDEAALASFSREVVAAGESLMHLRRELVPCLTPLVGLACRQIAADTEEARLEYVPAVKGDLAVELAQSRARERVYRQTLVGPHRDDLRLLLNEQSAAQFGSEGQKRTLAVAMKMAQAEYLRGVHGSPPILLIDDVMGELDPKRRGGLMPLLERAHQASGQVFMTCTEENWPRELVRGAQRWMVKEGTLKLQS